MGARELLHELAGAGFSVTAEADRLVIRPWSKLTDELRAALRASKPEVLALLAAEREADAEAFEERAAIMEFDGGLPRADAEAAARQCVDCEHLTRRRTCLEPVAAGLLTQAEGFGIAWPPEGHGAVCAAFSGKMPGNATPRPSESLRRAANDDPGTQHLHRGTNARQAGPYGQWADNESLPPWGASGQQEGKNVKITSWQRAGIVLSILWAVGAGIYTRDADLRLSSMLRALVAAQAGRDAASFAFSVPPVSREPARCCVFFHDNFARDSQDAARNSIDGPRHTFARVARMAHSSGRGPKLFTVTRGIDQPSSRRALKDSDHFLDRQLFRWSRFPKGATSDPPIHARLGAHIN